MTNSIWGAETTGKVHIGTQAGFTNQSSYAIAIGTDAGLTDQSQGAISIGHSAGIDSQGISAISIGESAGELEQGNYSVAIGYKAGQNNQPANTIVLNASGAELDGNTGPALYINPIRQMDNSGFTGILRYNPSSSEVIYDTTTNGFNFTAITYADDNDSLTVTKTGLGSSSNIISQTIIPGKIYLLTANIILNSTNNSANLIQIMSNQGWSLPPSSQVDNSIFTVFESQIGPTTLNEYNGCLSYSFLARSTTLNIYLLNQNAAIGTVTLNMRNVNLIQLN